MQYKEELDNCYYLIVYSLNFPLLTFMQLLLSLRIFPKSFIRTMFNYTICFPHVLSVSISCSSTNILMFSSFSSYYFLKDILIIPHSLQIYIVVNTVLYLYIRYAKLGCQFFHLMSFFFFFFLFISLFWLNVNNIGIRQVYNLNQLMTMYLLGFIYPTGHVHSN